MLTAKNLTFSYDSAPVLKGVSLHVEQGQTLSIQGVSGSGKTTLLNVLSAAQVETAPPPGVHVVEQDVPQSVAIFGHSGIERDDPDVMVLNYANPDMVGHTGDFDAAVAAVEAVDEQLGRLVEAVRAAGGHVLVTADHGNADDMGTTEAPHTAHTFNPVPFIYRTPDGTDGGHQIRDDGALQDVAPTLLADVPDDAYVDGKIARAAAERSGSSAATGKAPLP